MNINLHIQYSYLSHSLLYFRPHVTMYSHVIIYQNFIIFKLQCLTISFIQISFVFLFLLLLLTVFHKPLPNIPPPPAPGIFHATTLPVFFYFFSNTIYHHSREQFHLSFKRSPKTCCKPL